MSQRLNHFQASPGAMNTLIEAEKYISSCYKIKNTLDSTLSELVKIRVSQINGCAYCLDMHCKDARALGETEQRLHSLIAWRETNFFSEKERAALAWAEANTLIHQNEIDDQLYKSTREHFSEEQLVDLTLVITTINSWNRIAISFKPEVGGYQVGNFDL
ncbi:carboxymuconolactone decarboxylase [Marinomonas sp. S3726]|uniref:carboxymuconolactone decarboxylase family protein n=1 Tax=Marinomonas sp. S3726 TaxID=579484 RepID=UPI0005F9E66A|nr:carboxymuconolactone decarboxylase family protein [Marinomonas sp. S3726]KJZ13942.1 carboxymuconolactone decarboxylase [Marinomonas sp. S3726]